MNPEGDLALLLKLAEHGKQVSPLRLGSGDHHAQQAVEFTIIRIENQILLVTSPIAVFGERFAQHHPSAGMHQQFQPERIFPAGPAGLKS